MSCRAYSSGTTPPSPSAPMVFCTPVGRISAAAPDVTAPNQDAYSQAVRLEDY